MVPGILILISIRFMPWRFDLAERTLLVEAMPDDGIFVDVGANVGIYSLYVARHLGRNGRVLSFEPNPAAYERLETNVRLNNEALCCSISPLQLGIADQESFLDLHLYGGRLRRSIGRMGA